MFVITIVSEEPAVSICRDAMQFQSSAEEGVWKEQRKYY
jgi:hypothetical protein